MTTDSDLRANLGNGADSLHSSFREKLLEHVFVAELLQEVWLSNRQTMEVLRPEVDVSGYDLVLDREGVIRYVQLKSSRSDAKTNRQTVNSVLADKPGGCVIWLIFQECDRRVKLEYLVFGGRPNEKLDLGTKVGRHTKADATGYKAERPNTRVISRSRFTKMQSTSDLMRWLFD